MRVPALPRFAGLSLAAPVASLADWSLAEYCWSIWLAGLLFSWLCVITGGLQVMLTAPQWASRLGHMVPPVGRLPRAAAVAPIILIAAALTAILFQVYSFIFGFYGLFLSFSPRWSPIRCSEGTASSIRISGRRSDIW